jgi:NAD(P)-dependent dehydrogenase (short-subunit alcohol dehydrogenase family)
VVIPTGARGAVGAALRERLTNLGATVICVAVAGRHAHLLAKIPSEFTRHWTGLAKRHACYVLRDTGWSGKSLWGKRGKWLPIRDRAHQLNVYRYILRHRGQGAWTWGVTDEAQ